jgi:DNA repair protein RadC
MRTVVDGLGELYRGTRRRPHGGGAEAAKVSNVTLCFEPKAVPGLTGMQVKSPNDALRVMEAVQGCRQPQEEFWTIHLSTRNTVLGVRMVARGTVDASLVGIPDILRLTLLLNAPSFIIVHNHPSGDPHPSAEDHQLTDWVRRAGKLMQVRLLDHIIIGDTTDPSSFFSFRSAGYIT